MAKARALDKRRASIRNIHKITRTMELIASGRFKRALDRTTAATGYAWRLAHLVAALLESGPPVRHPLLVAPPTPQSSVLLVLTANRGMCGGYNAGVVRLALEHYAQLTRRFPQVAIDVSGKRGIAALKQRQLVPGQAFTHFEDRPAYADVQTLADDYIDRFLQGRIDRLDVIYTRYLSSARQEAVVETLLPLPPLNESAEADGGPRRDGTLIEVLPSAESMLDDIVLACFRIQLFKCFLDAATSEHVARMVAMKAATENADEIIRHLSMTYNRARQAQITGEIMEIIGGVEALQS